MFCSALWFSYYFLSATLKLLNCYKNLYDTHTPHLPLRSLTKELSIISLIISNLSIELSPKGQARPCIGGSCQTFEVAHQYHTISCPCLIVRPPTILVMCMGLGLGLGLGWSEPILTPFPSLPLEFKGMHKKYIHIYIYILKFILHLVAAPLSREYVIIYSIHKICNYCYIWPLKFTLKWNFRFCPNFPFLGQTPPPLWLDTITI